VKRKSISKEVRNSQSGNVGTSCKTQIIEIGEKKGDKKKIKLAIPSWSKKGGLGRDEVVVYQKEGIREKN